jgi:hypothetical protein
MKLITTPSLNQRREGGREGGRERERERKMVV